MTDLSGHMDTLGLAETRTIAGGVRMTDILLKAAAVDLIRAGSICSGRFLIQVAGPKADVSEALAAAEEESLLDTRIISRVHPEVLRALKRQAPLPYPCALGLVESLRAVSGIAAADAALKKADVVLSRLSVANGINGKSYLVLGGSVAAVTEAVEAACQSLGKRLLDRLVLPSPDVATARALCPLPEDYYKETP